MKENIIHTYNIIYDIYHNNKSINNKLTAFQDSNVIDGLSAHLSDCVTEVVTGD